MPVSARTRARSGPVPGRIARRRIDAWGLLRRLLRRADGGAVRARRDERHLDGRDRGPDHRRAAAPRRAPAVTASRSRSPRSGSPSRSLRPTYPGSRSPARPRGCTRWAPRGERITRYIQRWPMRKARGEHVHVARRRHAGARRPGGRPDGRIHARRLVGQLLGRRDDGADGRVRPLRAAARPWDLRDLRGALALRRRPDRRPPERHPKHVASTTLERWNGTTPP